MKTKTLLIIGMLLTAPVLAHESHQALQDAFMEAMRAEDAAAMAACYADDAISYDVAVQVQTGPAGVEASWGGFFSTYKLLEATLFGSHIEVHGDTGLAWGQFKLVVEPEAGGDSFEMVGRYSDVTRNIDGNWLYVMDHVSMPLPAADE